MIKGWPLTFYGTVKFASPHLYGGNVEQSFSQNVLKTNGRNLKCMIKAQKRSSDSQNLVTQGYLPLCSGLYINVWNYVIFKSSYLKLLDQFSPDFTWGFVEGVIVSLLK